MAHCGFEGTAVNDAFSHPLKALTVWWRGPRITGSMAPDLPVKYADGARQHGTVASIPLSEIKRASRESA
jgi:hypothetical protein